jgi:hypothetical protein
MTHSLSTHGGLTEPSRETMSGKGREGNKEGKGTRRASFSSWRLVSDARDRDAMMPLRARWSA